MTPETRYARTSDGKHVAYQISGQGPVDVVFAPGWLSNVDLIWENEEIEPFLRHLSTWSRLILFDRRGTGLSDHLPDAPDLETMMDDVRAVMDAAGSDRAVLIGATISCALVSLFAATFPDRTSGVVMIHPVARVAQSADYPLGETEEYFLEETSQIESGWGTGGFERWFLKTVGDPRADDPAYIASTARYLRHSMSRGAALLQNWVWHATDFRHVLPAVHAPTLVIERRAAVLGHAEYVVDRMPSAELALLEGEPILPWLPGTERTAERIRRFVDGMKEEEADLQRVLATILFTDVVDSTRRASEMGDAGWGRVMDEHNRIVRANLARYQGREIKTTGDGFLATFDGPARAIRAAQSIVRGVERVGVDVRAGLHTGECQVSDDDVSGTAVAIAARVVGEAGPREVLVSRTVRDLVAGAGLSFQDRGEHELKGVPGTWQLFAAVTQEPADV
jgi:class 3 adenylate cyclase